MDEEIKKVIEVLKSGGVILYPTDTIWGIGCDATNAKAVARVYDIKRRQDSKAMLVLVDDCNKLERYSNGVTETAYQLIEFSEKPLTIIFDEAKNLAPNLIGADGSIGIRVTKERFSKELCRKFGRPIVSTSANISGQKSPSVFSQISQEIKDSVDYIVNYRQNDSSSHTPSSIIKLGQDGVFKLIRN